MAVTTAVFVYLFRDLMTIRSPEGNDVLNEAEGLAMYMGTAERHRLEMFHPPEETPEVFEKLLPYAFALDTAETWANRFEDILKQNAYQPDWYTGANMAAFYSGGRGLITGIIRIRQHRIRVPCSRLLQRQRRLADPPEAEVEAGGGAADGDPRPAGKPVSLK